MIEPTSPKLLFEMLGSGAADQLELR